ncbi:MAG: bifunctional pyr operon transcriptional regulator/uracil phosphoribosyltransferase PyrR [Deltaproteobacteria bacterium]|nr:bifunctional pyr operon transcriptional regulator/uracil phosphoribosyltransferase PyrR [Deltaproteobacteria bacterium]MBN2688560.1 bifunctional pyr operon transcriptional regulator/uracil phosphoribosyltransferase PyrR [Deltaproteobacteria bacterium]
METSKIIMDAAGIERSLTRISCEIIEENKGVQDLVIIGIQKGGVFLAQRIAGKISDSEHAKVPFGVLDITLYRDDIMTTRIKPKMGRTDISFSLDDKKVILVDDVLFTGRTIRAAMDALMDFGRPKLIRLAVLIDRGHRELPIRADFVGTNLPSSLWEDIAVHLTESSGIDEVVIEKS